MRKVIIAILCLAAMTAGCSSDRAEAPSAPVAELETVTANMMPVPGYLRYVGTVEAADEADVSTKVMARIVRMPYDVGDRVGRGDTLAVLDSSDIEAMMDEAASAKAEAEAARDEAAAHLENMDINYERVKGLFDDGAATQKELDDIETARQAARAGVRRAEAAIARAAAGLAGAETMLGYCTPVSPFDGRITARYMDEGETVSPGMPLVRVSGTGRLRVSVPVGESELMYAKKVDKAGVVVDALGPGVIEASVNEIIPTADPSSRTVMVRLGLPAKTGALPGMSATVRFKAGEEKSVTVPAAAVLEREGVTGVFVVDDDLTVYFHTVRTGERLGDLVEVISGLNGGERVVTNPPKGLYTGMKAAR